MSKRLKRPRNDLERSIYKQLEKNGIEFGYEVEVIDYRQTVSRGICTDCRATRVYQQRRYTPDFSTASGIRIETKGRFGPSDRAKILLVIKQNPDLDLRLVFYSNNKLNKNKEERYLDWARKHGIKAALKEIPVIWLQQMKSDEKTTAPKPL